MHNRLSGLRLTLFILITLGTLSGLYAAYRRFHVEEANQRIEIALEWPEVTLLAQSSGHSVDDVLTRFREQQVSALVIAEDTLSSLEQSGAIRALRAPLPNAKIGTIVTADSQATLDRIAAAFKLRGLKVFSETASTPINGHNEIRTLFRVSSISTPGVREPNTAAPAAGAAVIGVAADYTGLRTMGVGLPPEALKAAHLAGLRVAGRISNFAGVNEITARAALESLRDQGASTVIFTGEEVLGYRGIEKNVAAMLDSPNTEAPGDPLPVYGAVEFGKQKGDEKFSSALHGNYIRVHSIQAAELAQMEQEEVIDRFVKAAKERNIRFCFVRLLTFAGPDPLDDNVKFLHKIARGMAHGTMATGGGMRFGAAHRYEETGVPTLVFGMIALGVAAGAVWMLRAICPLPARLQVGLLAALCLACFVAAVRLDETGRKLVAFLAGIAFPTAACMITYPRSRSARGIGADADEPLSPAASLSRAVRDIGLASLVTLVGIIHVVGLLATRPFMLRANQFLGIKAQHAVPLLLVAGVAVLGGVALKDESWERFRARAARQFQRAMDEPARFGLLILGVVSVAALLLIVARTGNDAGVGVSGTELKMRAILDRVLPVRPRTKEFLVGHPAYILALAWWYRGRRRLAIPAFVVGSLGQVSLLNTFCHVHTPLIVSAWRDGLGLVLGILFGAAVFLASEKILQSPLSTRRTRRAAEDL